MSSDSTCRRTPAAAGVLLLTTVLLLGSPPLLHSQVNGFASISYGYHGNPLYNYEGVPDQLRQSYLEMKFQHESEQTGFSLGYISGLMLFNTFTDRNYYEHRGQFSYHTSFGSLRPPLQSEQAEDDSEDQEEVLVDRDSVLSYLGIVAFLGARHDKEAYREFDNTGAGLTADFRFRLGSLFMRASNEAGYRSYAHLSELSNITESVRLQIGKQWTGGGTAGIQVVGGVKYFTTDSYDTTRFEPSRTYVEKANGKGKGGAKLVVPSEKQILVNAATTTTVQLAAGAFAGVRWIGGTLDLDLLYRHNPGDGTRYLAQYANTSILSEDIYNDYFSSDGPVVRLRGTQALPLGLQAIVTVDAARKRFSAPALRLDGETNAEKRVDLHSSAELWLSRYIELSESLGIDLALSVGAARNESNDDYNDFALVQVAMSFGIGF